MSTWWTGYRGRCAGRRLRQVCPRDGPGCSWRWPARIALPPRWPQRKCLPPCVIRARRHLRRWSATPAPRRCSGGAAPMRPAWRPVAPTVRRHGAVGRMRRSRRERLADYLRGLDALMARYGLSGASYGHFGEGCMHMRIDFDLLSAPVSPLTGRSSRRPPTSSSPSAARSPANTATDGRARNCLAACTARQPGPARRDETPLGPGLADEPAISSSIRPHSTRKSGTWVRPRTENR